MKVGNFRTVKIATQHKRIAGAAEHAEDRRKSLIGYREKVLTNKASKMLINFSNTSWVFRKKIQHGPFKHPIIPSGFQFLRELCIVPTGTLVTRGNGSKVSARKNYLRFFKYKWTVFATKSWNRPL